MSGYKAGKLIRVAVRVLFIAVCYLAAVHLCTEAQKNADIIIVMLQGASLTADSAGELCTQEEEQEAPLYTCFWGEQADTAVSCRETGVSSSVTEILFLGNPELVMSGTHALTWQENGCFIDEETAQELFGAAQAAGQILWCGDSPYVVCGTFESLRRTLVRKSTQEDGACLNRVSLQNPDASVQADAGQFLMRSGISGKAIQFSTFCTLAGDCLLLLPLLLAAGLIRHLWGRLTDAGDLRKKAACIGALLIVAAVAAGFAWHYLQIPADMIPSQWSDFSFWPEWWKEQRQNLLLVFGSAQGEAQLLILWKLFASLLFNLLAVFAVL